MGAQIYMVTATGKTLQDAFRNAQEEARRYYGSRRYTGSIAEKDCFVLIEVPKGKKPEVYARQLIDEADPRIDDKCGPSGAILLKKNKYLFFGWASS